MSLALSQIALANLTNITFSKVILQLQTRVPAVDVIPTFSDGLQPIDTKFLFRFMLLNTTVNGVFQGTPQFWDLADATSNILHAKNNIPQQFRPKFPYTYNQIIATDNHWGTSPQRGELEINDNHIQIKCDHTNTKKWNRDGNIVYGFSFTYETK